MSALNDLLKKNNKSRLPAAAAAVVTASVVAFSFAKLEGPSSSIESASQNNASSSAAGFGGSNLVVPPPAATTNSSTGSTGGTNNSSSYAVGSDGLISDDALEEYIPPEGIVVRDGKGNVIYKRCRKPTEGQATAKAEMEKEQDRYNKFTKAVSKYIPAELGGGGDAGSYQNSCYVTGKKAPKESPCPSYQEYMSLRDFYKQQYYDMSNQLQKNAALNEQCRSSRDLVMTAADPSWRSDRGIASETASAQGFSGVR